LQCSTALAGVFWGFATSWLRQKADALRGLVFEVINARGSRKTGCGGCVVIIV
jgi:hypothetical protein